MTHSLSDLAPDYIRAIAPYSPGKPITQLARETGIPLERIVKLASNENPLGMSPKARAAIDAALAGAERYPDDFELKSALSERTGVPVSGIVLGNGSNDVLDMLARVFLAPGRASVFSQYAFAVYPIATQTQGARAIVTPAKNYGHDLDAMLAAITADTRVVWIANPNNPTGSFLSYASLHAFCKAVPSDVIVVLDEAYNEYLPPAERVDTTQWLREFPNLVITRTFSKIYGMAGLRVGYALAHEEIAALMNRVRQPFNCNNLALAGAIAALDDAAFIAQSYELNRAGLEQILAGIKRLGLGHIPAHGNFVAFHVADAAAINRKLLEQGVIVRPLAGYGLTEHLRVSIGRDHENARFLEALERALHTA